MGGWNRFTRTWAKAVYLGESKNQAAVAAARAHTVPRPTANGQRRPTALSRVRASGPEGFAGGPGGGTTRGNGPAVSGAGPGGVARGWLGAPAASGSGRAGSGNPRSCVGKAVS